MKSSWKSKPCGTVDISWLSPRTTRDSTYPVGFRLPDNIGVDRLEYLFPNNHAEVYEEIRLACAEYPEYFI